MSKKKPTALGILLEGYSKASREYDKCSIRATAAYSQESASEKALLCAIDHGTEKEMRLLARQFRVASETKQEEYAQLWPRTEAKNAAKAALFAELLKRGK